MTPFSISLETKTKKKNKAEKMLREENLWKNKIKKFEDAQRRQIEK